MSSATSRCRFADKKGRPRERPEGFLDGPGRKEAVAKTASLLRSQKMLHKHPSFPCHPFRKYSLWLYVDTFKRIR